MPQEIFEELKDKIVFYSTAQRDAVRLSRHVCQNKEIILISERILPKRNASEDQPIVRYFIFAVLHEVVHALKKHRSQAIENLSDEEVKEQETEADDLALIWFNTFTKQQKSPHLKELTIDEINEIRAKNQKTMKSLYENF